MRAIRVLLHVLGMALLLGCGHKQPAGFITMENGAFRLDGKPFFPVAVNYLVDLQWMGDSCWAASCKNYERGDTFRFNTRHESLLQIKGEFEVMKRSGFNTVRIVGFTSDLVEPPGGGPLVLQGRYGMGLDSLYSFAGVNESRYLDAVEDVVELAAAMDLKLIVLLRMRPDLPAFEQRSLKLVERLKDQPAVLAYDLFNEPLYFDLPHHRPKVDVHAAVKRWRRSIRALAPQQLVTIGLVGVPEVFAWDPNILDVDFISFHPYEYEPEQVRNEIRWYGDHVDKPWIIGETAIPADNDSVPYADQLAFARKTLAQTVACGGQGYSWWQFKDVHWGRYHADFMGVVNRHDQTETGPGLPAMQGTVKPVAEAFREFDPWATPAPCAQLPNYYNFSSLHTARLTGSILDDDRKPVEGAVVLGWDENWTRAYYTISKPDGSFALYGDFRFHHWMVSATRHAMERGDCQPGAFLTGSDGVAEYYLGAFALEDLQLDESR